MFFWLHFQKIVKGYFLLYNLYRNQAKLHTIKIETDVLVLSDIYIQILKSCNKAYHKRY